MDRLTFRAKLMAILGTAIVSLLVLIISSAVFGSRVSGHMQNIQQNLLPRMELGPQLEGDFDHLRRSQQDAVSSGDREALASSQALEIALLARIGAARIEPGQADA